MSATPGTPRSAASFRPKAPAAGPARVGQDRVEMPIRGLGRGRRVEQEPSVLVVEQHALAISANRHRRERGRHVQNMLDGAEVEPVPLQLGQSEPAVGVRAEPAHQRRLGTELGGSDRGVGRHATHHGVQVVGDMLARDPRQLAVAEDEVDHGDADAQNTCHCLPVSVAITVARLARAVHVGRSRGRSVARRHHAVRLPERPVARACAVTTAKGTIEESC
jgi:hypothetical protein